MLRSLNRTVSKDRERYKVPRNTQDIIPVKRIHADGIFLTGRRFSRTWKFSDINYSSEGEERREELLIKYRELLNCLDTDAETKITVINRRLDLKELEQSVLFKERRDGLDMYRHEYNDIILSQVKEGSGIIQDKYITVSVGSDSVEEARSYFERAEEQLSSSFSIMGSVLSPLDAAKKLRILHGIYRNYDMPAFDLADTVRKGEDFRNLICADSAEITPSYVRLGDRYFRTLYLKYYANAIGDDFMKSLTGICPDMMLSVDILPVPADEAVREAESRLLGIETNITGWQRKQNRSSNFSAAVPYDLQLQRKETREFLEDLASRDQRMMLVVITVMVSADDQKELDRLTESVMSFGRSRMCQIAELRFRQLEGLNTVLPVGARKIEAFRTLVTDSLAVFIPFRVQEISEKRGIYMGTNAVSGNPLFCNRERLMNQSAFLLGVPGSGKSFLAKQMIMTLLLGTDDDILICDPEGEYVPIAEAAADQGRIVRISAHSGDRINPMYIDPGETDGSSVIMKSELIQSLIERIEEKPVSARQRSVIDRCIRKVYRDCRRTGVVPTLTMLRDELLRQSEPEAAETALSLEIYTSGSLSIFAGEGDPYTGKRLTVFDIHEMEDNLKAAGLLIITDTMLNRVNGNSREGRRTHIFIDEFHVVFSNAHSARFFSSAWRQFRKRNAYPTAITQNVDTVLESPEARTMLSNSEFVIMLSQAASDREKLAELLRISEDQLRYIGSGGSGCGLMKYGGALVPFVNRLPKDTGLYSLMTTTPGERRFS